MLDSIEVMCMRRRILGLRCCLNSSRSMSEMERKDSKKLYLQNLWEHKGRCFWQMP